jgi:hypothetical protein
LTTFTSRVIGGVATGIVAAALCDMMTAADYSIGDGGAKKLVGW